jgi:hypothetical protein
MLTYVLLFGVEGDNLRTEVLSRLTLKRDLVAVRFAVHISRGFRNMSDYTDTYIRSEQEGRSLVHGSGYLMLARRRLKVFGYEHRKDLALQFQVVVGHVLTSEWATTLDIISNKMPLRL